MYPQCQHTPIKAAITFVAKYTAHAEQLLLIIDVNALLDEFELLSAIVAAIVEGEGALLNFCLLTLNNLDEKKHDGANKALVLLELQH